MRLLFILVISCFFSGANAQQKASGMVADSSQAMIVDAACGQCRFRLPGKGCNLAVRIDGKAYFVDGTDIDSHGDAHAADGFCKAVRKAKVSGQVVDGRFRATSFALLPQKAKGE